MLECDLLVLGSGIAGLRAALEAAGRGWRVLVATKDLIRESNTDYAQGGIAAAMDPGDSPADHLLDTLQAGDGLCDKEAVQVLVEDGPKRIRELITWGAQFDLHSGSLHFTREAAHSRNRILHSHGDATGRELSRVLVLRAGATPEIQVFPFHSGLALILEEGRCTGAWLLDERTNRPAAVKSRAVVIATGGVGRLFKESTNPSVATGDGIAMALEAGTVLSNLEFVQFHPTALFMKNAPRFLLSESMRGEGALLRNVHGETFMHRYHPDAELAPRDVVSRAVVLEIKATRAQNVFLDLTHLDPKFLRRRFPMIYATCIQYGIDMTSTPIPVHPAAHYMMGGIETDTDGRSSIPGLYASGEAACTGVHGANRLASNSLLEGLVFGARAAAAAVAEASSMPLSRHLPAPPDFDRSANLDIINNLRRQIAALMWEGVGITRNALGLEMVRAELANLKGIIGRGAYHRRALETRNMLVLGDAIAACAEYRTESRGAHFRQEFPERDDENWRRPTRLVTTRGQYQFLEVSA